MAAHFVLNVAEGIVEGVAAIDREHSPAGFARHPAQLRFAAASAESSVGSAIRVVDAVDNRVGLLGRFNRLVASLLATFIDAVGDLARAAQDPHRLTDYLYELAEKFNAFFRDCRVEGAPEQDSRLLLCELTARVLRQGLHILGLQTVDRM